MITTVTASKIRKAMTPTRVPTNTGIGIAAALVATSACVKTAVDLSASVAFIEVVVISVSSSSSVVEAVSKPRVVSNCKVVIGSKDLKAGVLDAVKHNTLLKSLALLRNEH